MADLNVFITKIITLCNGDFVKTFDTDKNGTVTKSEFQNVCLTSGTLSSGQRDIIDDFWNSIDFNCGDGKIKGTNCFNYNALDGSELLGVDKTLGLFKQISGLVESLLEKLKPYTNTYEYLLGKSIEHLKGLGIADEDALKAEANTYIQELIEQQNVALRDAMIKDAIAKVLGSTSYKPVENYDPYEDQELLDRIGDVVGQNNFLTIGEDGPIQTIIDYFENKESDSDIGKMKTVAVGYFSSASPVDSANNYQRARIAAIYKEQAKNLFPNDLSVDQKAAAEGKLPSVITQATDEIFETLCSGNNNKLNIQDVYLNSNNKYAFCNTNAGILFNDYLQGLSLGDFDEGPLVAKGFYDKLVAALVEYGLSNTDARTVAKYLAENDTKNGSYQEIVNMVCEYLYKNTTFDNSEYSCTNPDGSKTTSDKPFYEDYVINAIIYGCSDLSIDSIIDGLLEGAGVAKAGGSKEPGGDNYIPESSEPINTISTETKWGGISTTTQYRETAFCKTNISEKAEAWRDAKSAAKDLVKNICDSIIDYYNSKGCDAKACQEAYNMTKSYFEGILDKIDILNCIDGAQSRLYADGEFTIDNCKLYYENDDAKNWDVAYSNDYSIMIRGDVSSGVGYKVMINSQHVLDKFMENYNNYANKHNFELSGEKYTSLSQMGSVKPLANVDKTLSEILNDKGTIGGIQLAGEVGLENAKDTAIRTIGSVLNSVKEVLLENGINEDKIGKAITNTINYYKAAIGAMTDQTASGTSDEKNVEISFSMDTYDGKEISGNTATYKFYGCKDSSGIDITGSKSMKAQISGCGLRLEEAHNGKDANSYYIGVNISAMFKMLESFLSKV